MYLLAQLPAETLSVQLKNGVILMGLGMAIVFAFLALLVVVTKVVSKIVRGGKNGNAASSAEVEELKKRISALEGEIETLKAQAAAGPSRVRGYGAAVPKSPLVFSSAPAAPAAPAPAASSAPAASAPAPAAAPAATPAAPAGGQKVNAPMPGLILRIDAKPGQAVKKNQLVMVMEAMKMENEIYAPCDGTIASVAVNQGQQVSSGDLLFTIG